MSLAVSSVYKNCLLVPGDAQHRHEPETQIAFATEPTNFQRPFFDDIESSDGEHSDDAALVAATRLNAKSHAESHGTGTEKKNDDVECTHDNTIESKNITMSEMARQALQSAQARAFLGLDNEQFSRHLDFVIDSRKEKRKRGRPRKEPKEKIRKIRPKTYKKRKKITDANVASNAASPASNASSPKSDTIDTTNTIDTIDTTNTDANTTDANTTDANTTEANTNEPTRRKTDVERRNLFRFFCKYRRFQYRTSDNRKSTFDFDIASEFIHQSATERHNITHMYELWCLYQRQQIPLLPPVHTKPQETKRKRTILKAFFLLKAPAHKQLVDDWLIENTARKRQRHAEALETCLARRVLTKIKSDLLVLTSNIDYVLRDDIEPQRWQEIFHSI
jgi:hypothetical protein